jgi:hypothetical protein
MDKKSKKSKDTEDTPKVYGDPVYGPNEDIYAQGENVGDPEKEKKPAHPIKSNLAGEDLDIPGAELDDADEGIGEEDEENNYYSLGGDNHEDLEETKED